MSTLAERLRAACKGHPHAKIPWPHRLLHEAADEIERLEKLCLFRRENFEREPKLHAAEIEAAHPLETGRHELWDQALTLVSERSEKYELVCLVNWLLARIDTKENTDG